MKRNEAREEVFYVLFEQEVGQSDIEEIMELAAETREAVYDNYAKGLIAATMAHITEIDELIGNYSKSWKLERLPKVTTAILRLAIAEILYLEDIPESVSANEAVELAKKFALPEDASYINGILGAFIKDKNQI